MAKSVFKATEGILSRATDLTLALIFYSFALGGARNMRGVEKVTEGTLELLSDINYKSIKRALQELKRKGLVKTARSAWMEVELTAAGKKRIRASLPQYRKKRPWDKNLYLVTYDIPITHNRDRDSLREFLRRLGCGLLQESIWITPYNPTQIVRDFVKEKSLEGTVLVSVLGKDGSIGEMSFEELIERVYALSELNERYEQFVAECAQKNISHAQATFLYLSILKDDPQLPFELLPDWWLGDKAYKAFTKLVGRS